jgi:hypothetical protein
MINPPRKPFPFGLGSIFRLTAAVAVAAWAAAWATPYYAAVAAVATPHVFGLIFFAGLIAMPYIVGFVLVWTLVWTCEGIEWLRRKVRFHQS